MENKQLILFVTNLAGKSGTMTLEGKNNNPICDLIVVHQDDYDSVRGLHISKLIFDSTVDNDNKAMFCSLVKDNV